MVKRSVIAILAGALAFIVLVGSEQGYAQQTPQRFPDARDRPPANWTGPVFKLSQDYPSQLPTEVYPWKQFDFQKQWKDYMLSVLKYCYEGNVENDWELQKNSVRRWYHAPWLHWGRNGREYVHGLTHERVSQPEELSRSQRAAVQNWAVGMYNAPGGYVLGRVWRDPRKPDPLAARFPDGTVSCKLLFTQATPDQVPYLKGSIEWKAFIYQSTVSPTNPLGDRSIQAVRLLQIDIAVRDDRANNTTGWVFGTFVYSADAPGKTPWDRMVPVGLMWGNDPKITVQMVRSGITLKETIINDAPELPHQHLGWAGRLNGPVDNPISSCLSCHAQARWSPDNPASLTPPRNAKPDSPLWLKWFENVPAGEPAATSLDYSLQLLTGIQNLHEWLELESSLGGSVNRVSPTLLSIPSVGSKPGVPRFPISRDGSPD